MKDENTTKDTNDGRFGIGKPICREGSHKLGANRPTRPRVDRPSVDDTYRDEYGKMCRVLTDRLEDLLNKYR